VHILKGGGGLRKGGELVQGKVVMTNITITKGGGQNRSKKRGQGGGRKNTLNLYRVLESKKKKEGEGQSFGRNATHGVLPGGIRRLRHWGLARGVHTSRDKRKRSGARQKKKGRIKGGKNINASGMRVAEFRVGC